MMRRLSEAARGDSLKAKSLRSTFWTMLGFGSQSLLRLGSNLILARLLVPEMFGLMALAFMFLNGITLMSDVGTKHSVIRSTRGEDPEFLRTAWTVQVLRGFLIAVIACLLAWPMAKVYEQPELFAVLCVLSLTTVFTGFSSISMATTSRNMQLARQTLVTLLTQAVTISTMVYFAWKLESVWALVIGGVLGSALNAALTHVILPPFKHRFRLEREALKELIGFGRWVLFSTMFTFLGGRGITAIHGLLVSIETLGILSISTTLIRSLEDLVTKLLNNVGFPALSKTMRENPEAVARILARVRNTLVLGSMALFVSLAFVAQAVIDFLYPLAYSTAGSFLAIQSLNGAARVLAMPYQNALLAAGNSRAHAGIMLFSALAGIAATVAGFYILGPYGMLLGMGVAALLVFAISAWFAHVQGHADLRFDLLIVLALLGIYVFILDRLLG